VSAADPSLLPDPLDLAAKLFGPEPDHLPGEWAYIAIATDAARFDLAATAGRSWFFRHTCDGARPAAEIGMACTACILQRVSEGASRGLDSHPEGDTKRGEEP